jgi:hypothetical protein
MTLCSSPSLPKKQLCSNSSNGWFGCYDKNEVKQAFEVGNEKKIRTFFSWEWRRNQENCDMPTK